MRDQMKTKAGTPYYIAPEVLKGAYSQLCDIWSLGVILYILLSGSPPFYGNTDKQILTNVLKINYDFDGEEWEDISDEAKNLIKKMLTQEQIRLTIEQVFQEPFMTINIKPKSLKNFPINKLQHYTQYNKLKQWLLQYIGYNLDQNQLKDITDMFNEIDKDHDGSISYEEFLHVFINNKNLTKEQ